MFGNISTFGESSFRSDTLTLSVENTGDDQGERR